MKRLFVTMLLALVTLCSYGQSGRLVHGCVFDAKGIPIEGAQIATINGDVLCRTNQDGTFKAQTSSLMPNLIITSDGYKSKRVTSDGSYLVIKMFKDREVYPAKRGFQQQVSFGWWWSESWDDPNYSALRFSYIGGWRFNDYFFAGVGAGLDIGVSNTYKPTAKESVDYWGDYYYKVETAGGWYEYEAYLPMQSIAIPLFVNFKGYFTKTKVAPYISFSAGARLSTGKKLELYYGDDTGEQRYGAFKPFFEVAAGVNYRKSADRNYTFQFGYYTHNIKDFYGWKGYFNLDNEWSHGFSMSVGMTF